MSPQLLSSKIIVQEEPASMRVLSGGATGVCACVGVAAMGPVGIATRLSSAEEFSRIFGGDIAAGISAAVVRGYFQNGGERMYFTRVVHHKKIGPAWIKMSAPGTLTLLSAAGVPAPAQATGAATGPFQLAPGLTLIIGRDAAGEATATFNATSGRNAGGSGPFTLTANQALQVRIDGANVGAPVQTFVFTAGQFANIASATAAEVAAAINETITGAQAGISGEGLEIVSDSSGTASSVEICGGSAMVGLGFTASTAAGTGNVADIDAVTVAEIKTVVEAAVSGTTVADVSGKVRISAATTGTGGVLQVMPASTAADELGISTDVHNGTTGAALPTLKVSSKYDGVYAGVLKVLISPATSGLPTQFNLSVVIGNTAVEVFPNLTMLDTSANHVEAVINAETGSRLISVEDLQLSPGNSGVLAERPGDSSGSPRIAFGPLTGGDDGLAGTHESVPYALEDSDFIGEEGNRLGFHSFDLTNDIETLICPESATPAVHLAQLAYVSVTRKGEMFAVLDPPQGLSEDGINNYVLNVAQLKNTTEYGAVYWPRVRVLNPSAALYGNVASIVVPPCGVVAGMYARVDGSAQGGVYLPPGGCERGQLAGVVGFEFDSVLSERVRDLIAPNCINPISRVRGWPIAVDDVMTLAPGGNFPTIGERRGVTFIERAIKDGLQFCRLRNNDEILRLTIFRVIQAFLIGQMKVGAFRSRNPSTAFFVDVSDALNPPSEIFAGRVNVRVGLATNKPARFIILNISQDTRALDEELAAAG